MIEFATPDNGPTDLPVREMPDGTIQAQGGLEAMHASRQRAVVDQVRKGILAEELGFHYYFLTEHHFQPEGAEFSPNPLMIDLAVAMRTKRIRLGQLANILSWHHPLRIAEQAAMLDVLSGGRLEFGIGRGAMPREMEVFGQVYGTASADELRNRQYVDECMEIILKAWTEPSFSYHGQFYSIPPRYTAHHHPMTIGYFSQPDAGRTVDEVLQLGGPTGSPQGIRSHATTLKELSVFPQPVQKPHPQIWMPVVRSAESIRSAARKGYNCTFVAMNPDRVREEIEIYYEEAARHGFPDYRDRGRFKYGWDCEKKRGLIHAIGIHIVDHGIGSREKYIVGQRHLGRYLSGFGPAGTGGNRGEGHERPQYVGPADQIVHGILELKEAGGYEDFLCSVGFHFAGLTWEETEEQMRAFAADVMPVLKRECGGSPELPVSELTW